MTNMRKTVSFGDFSTVVVVTEEAESSSLWYNKEEFRAIREDYAMAFEESPPRGLEMDDDSSLRRKNHVQSVLALQEEHKDHRLQDETGLKRFSSALSKDDLKQAQKRASQDSKDAFQLHAAQKELSSRYLRAKDAEEYSRPTKARNFLRRCAKSMGSMPPSA